NFDGAGFLFFVDVRLTVCDDHNALTMEVLAQRSAQSFCIPASFAGLFDPLLRNSLDKLPEITDEGENVLCRFSRERFAELLNPAMPCKACSKEGDTGGTQGQQEKSQEKMIASGVLAVLNVA